MLFQAQRGVSTEFPENTMPAFQAALEQGYQVIELDPVFTADGQCVVFHDATVNRTCRTDAGEPLPEGSKVTELTWEQLQALDAGLFMGEAFRGTKVPLLSEALAFGREKNLLIKLDNKFERFEPHLRENFLTIVENSGARVAFTCGKTETIRELAPRFPEAEIHYDGPVDETALETVKGLLRGNPLTVWLPLPSRLTTWVKVPMATPELCRMVKTYGKLGLWILETETQLEEAVSLGADIIETTGSVKPR